ncbi:MAG TPA: SxtJ family membrane protein [Nitrospira sp.]|nr:SxtJ family membrane protein [Nitrospira sp.]
MESQEVTKKVLRQFGLMVGGIFLVIALWPLVWRQEPLRSWALVVGLVLTLTGAVMPEALRQIYRGWMFLGHVLGWVNTRIILGILFYGIVTPMGIVMKLTGRDPMRRGFDPEATTYRVPREPRPASHMKNMF